MKAVLTYCGISFEIDHRWYTTPRDLECDLRVDTEFSARGGGYLRIRVGVYADNTLLLSAEREDTDVVGAFNGLYSALRARVVRSRSSQTPLYRLRAFELIARVFCLVDPSPDILYRELLEAAAIADAFAPSGTTQAVRKDDEKD